MPMHFSASFIRCFGVSFFFLLATGCLYLPIPYWKVTPHKSMRRVVVLDKETQKPLENAEVVFWDKKWGNWLPPSAFDMWWGYDGWARNDGSGPIVTGRRVGLGTFDIPRKTHICCLHFTCFGLPLGGVLIQSRSGKTFVSANGYRTVWFTDRLCSVKSEKLADHYYQPHLNPSSKIPVPFQFTAQGVVVCLEKNPPLSGQGDVK